MYVNIRTRLFLLDPAVRFGISFHCSPDVWRKVWYRYKILGYTRIEAREYLIIILKVPISTDRFNRWVNRTEIYLQAQDVVHSGVKTVESSYFGKQKDFVEKETTKNK